MKFKDILSELFLVFFIITACITILTGILGTLFFPDMQLGFDAFFSPPLFGFLSALTGLVTISSRELSVRQVMLRRLLQLLLIELIVFGVNYLAGNSYGLLLNVVLALSIAVVYVVVYLVIWLNDWRSAKLFNEQLKRFQLQNNKQ